jgi:hypothetical protein
VDEYHTTPYNGRMSVEASFLLLYMRDEEKQSWGNKVVSAEKKIIIPVFVS